ncbi:hypothetical protein Saa2_01965 [Streptomyces acidiscabies]|nr:hypothetical protein Saa2_01965 [Streptomyces acidiscabies]
MVNPSLRAPHTLPLMRWGTLRAARLSWTPVDTHVAAATAAAQIPAALVVWVALSSGQDDYGITPPSLGWACVLLFAPLWVPVTGMLQTALLARPAGTLAALKGGWSYYLGATALVSALWATIATLTLSAPLFPTAAALTALGILPMLAVLVLRRRSHPWSAGGVWWRSVPASVALFGVVLTGVFAADTAGLIPEYDPPRLSTDRLTGVWRGADGAELDLRPGGRAEANALPAQRPDGDWSADKVYDVCDATGTWFLDTEGRYDGYDGEGPEERDGAVVRLEGCGADTYWVVGGTADSPELFVLFGDPDAGDLRILRPARLGVNVP